MQRCLNERMNNSAPPPPNPISLTSLSPKNYSTTLSKSRVLKRFRLRTVLVIPFIIPIIVSTGLVGWFSFLNGQQAIDDLATQLNNEMSARIKQHVLDYLNKPHNVLQVTYATVQSGNLNLNDFDGLQRYFWQVVHKGELVNYPYFGNEQGEFIGVEHQENGTVQLKIRTIATAPNRETYQLNDRGNRKELLKKAEYDPRTRPWYEAAKQAGLPAWSPIFPAFSRQNTSLEISPVRPVYDSNGKLLGVLSMNLALVQITEFLKDLYISPHGQSFIMERSGDLVVSSTIPEPFVVIENQRVEERKIERLAASDSKNITVKATAEYLKQHFGSFNAINNSQRLKFQIDGAWHYIQVMPIQDGRGLDWLAVVVVPEADFMARIHANTRTTILLCSLTLVGATTIGILTARWINRQILKLNKASQAMANGDLNQQVQVEGIIEIENLAGSFNSMAHQLNESFKTLEAKNEALRIAEENYRSIFENALEGIFQSTPDGHFINVNPAMARILGYDSPQEMIASITNIQTQVYAHPSDRNQFHTLIQNFGQVKDFEYQAYQKDGSIIWVGMDARAVHDSSGHLLYYEGIVQDISQRKQQEEELRRQLQELRIEIDHQKRERDVAQITQSDYFQELQEEVAELQLDEFWS